MKTAGIVILIIGLIFTIFTSINFTTEEEVVELGEFEVTREEEHELELSPWIGVGVMVVGGVLVVAGRKK